LLFFLVFKHILHKKNLHKIKTLILPRKISLKIIVRIFVILSLLAQAGCGSLSLKNDLAKENNFRLKKQEMDDALSMCWDATVNHFYLKMHHLCFIFLF